MNLGHYLEAEKGLSDIEINDSSIKDKITFKILSYRIQIGFHRYLEILKDIDSTINTIKQNGLKKELLKDLNMLTNEIFEFGKKGELVGFRIKANHIRWLTVWIQQLHGSELIKNANVEELLLEVQSIAEKYKLTTTTQQFTG